MSTAQPTPPIDWWQVLIFNATSELIIISLFAIFVTLVWFLWTFIMPVDAKTLFRSKVGAGRRRSIILMVSDDGYARIYLGEPMPQGIINIGTRVRPRYLFLPRPFIPEEPSDVPQVDREGKPLPPEQIEAMQRVRDSQIELNKAFPIHEEFALKRVFWSGLNRPVYIAYSGKSVAVAPQVLAVLGLPEPQQTRDPQPNSWSRVIKRTKHLTLEVKKDAELLFGVLLDPRVIKTAISNLYTEAQLRKIHSDAYTAGQESMRGSSRNMVVPIMLIMIVLIIGIVALKIAEVF